MSLDDWKTAIEIIGVVTLFVTFVLGGWALLIGKQIGKRDSETIRNLEKQTAETSERAEKLENQNLELRKTVGLIESGASESAKEVAALQKAATDAKAAQQRVQVELALQEQRTEELRSKNIETARALEKERTERAELEKTVAPRSLMSTSESTARLRKFSGTPVVIEFESNDNEAKRLALYIYGSLEQAQWDIRQVSHATNLLPDGIVVEVERGGPEKDEFGDTARAAIQLGEFLEANDLDVRVSPHAAWRTTESDKPLLIRVGSKPTWAFFDRERSPAWEAEREKRWEEWVKAQPPVLRNLIESAPPSTLETDEARRKRLKEEWFPPRAPMPPFPIPPKE